MSERVAQRPLLVERAAADNARLAVENRFRKTLKKAGVSKDMDTWELDPAPSSVPDVPRPSLSRSSSLESI